MMASPESGSQAGRVESMGELTGLTHDQYAHKEQRMPYRRRGKLVQVRKDGVWRRLKRHRSVQNAIAHLRAFKINVEGKHE